jgi:protein disulfide-isomerase A1
LFKSFDEKRNDFDGAINASTLESFINAYGNPVLLPFNDKAINIIF